jgi:hypothetical protein
MKKILLSLFLLVAVSVFTVGSYAFWDNLSSTESDNNISLGENATLVATKDITVITPAGKTLVPDGAVMGINDIQELTEEYIVTLSKTPLIDYRLKVSVYNVLIGGDIDIHDLINIDIEYEDNKFDGTKINVTLKVSIRKLELGEGNLYQDIKGKDISFQVEFIAEPKI